MVNPVLLVRHMVMIINPRTKRKTNKQRLHKQRARELEGSPVRHGGETKEKELILSQVGGGMREDRRVRPRTGGRA